MDIETLNHFLLVAIIFVLVGVVMESFEHVAEYKKHGWKPVMPKIGFVLLVIGLAAELTLHPLMEQADTKIRIEADQKIAGLNKELEDERTKRVEDEKAV